MAADEQESVESECRGEPYPRLARYFLWVDSVSGVNRLITALVALCVFLFLIDFFIHRHASVPGEETTGYHAVVGFIAFTLIVLGAKLLRVFIRRDESYYAPYGVDAESYPDAGLERLTYREDVSSNPQDDGAGHT